MTRLWQTIFFLLAKQWITCFVLSLKNWFQFCYNIHNYSTTFSIKGHLHKKIFRANNFEKFSVTVSAIDSWNKIQDQSGEKALKDLRPGKIKWLLTNKFIKSYWLIYFSFYQILFILCEYIMGHGIVLSVWLCFPQPYNC